VCVTADGNPPKGSLIPGAPVYDEIVIDQECQVLEDSAIYPLLYIVAVDLVQVLPVFVVMMDKDKIRDAAKKFAVDAVIAKKQTQLELELGDKRRTKKDSFWMPPRSRRIANASDRYVELEESES